MRAGNFLGVPQAETATAPGEPAAVVLPRGQSSVPLIPHQKTARRRRESVEDAAFPLPAFFASAHGMMRRAMTGRDAEIVARLRKGYEAFNRGNFDAALKLAHPQVRYFPAGGLAPVSGAEPLRTRMEPSAFAEQRIEPLDFTVAGKKVLVLQHSTARGSASGIELEVDSWSVFTLDDQGLVTRVENYLRRQEAEAREAAGLKR